MPSHPITGNEDFHGFKAELIGCRGADTKTSRRRLVATVNGAELSAGGKMRALNEGRGPLENRRRFGRAVRRSPGKVKRLSAVRRL